MNERTLSSRGPVVETRDVAVIYMAKDVDGLGGQMPARFRKAISLVAECRAKLNWIHGGVTLMEGAEFHDWYGWTDSVPSASEEAASLAEAHGVTADSSLVLEVRASMSLSPVLAGSGEPHFGRTRWQSTPDGWHLDGEGAEKAMLDWHEGRGPWEDVPKTLAALAVSPVQDVLVWSSKNGDTDNAAAMAAFVALANEAANVKAAA